MRTTVRQGNALDRETALLLQGGLVIFVVTVVIGVLNGLDIVEFDRRTLLTHVHAGALGWLTLGVLAASLWLFSGGQSLAGWRASWPRPLSVGAIGAIALYVVAFYSGNLTLRPIVGTLALLALVGFYAWVVAQSRCVVLSTAHIALLAALTTLTLGASIGVILGVYLAGGLQFLPSGLYVTHPSTMVVGYLILAGMAITEWRLMPDRALTPASRAGILQVALPFIGGLTLTVGALLNVFALIVLNVPFEVLGVIIYLWRVGPRIARIRWTQANGDRQLGMSALFMVANVGLIAYLIVNYADKFDQIPPWLFFAMDHAMFIGVMTNALFSLAWAISHGRSSFWPWADHVAFWGTNVGVAGFVVGLILDSPGVKEAFAPIMGISILTGIVAYTVRLRAQLGAARLYVA